MGLILQGGTFPSPLARQSRASLPPAARRAARGMPARRRLPDPPRERRWTREPILLAAAALLVGCGPTLPPRVYSMDRVYHDACPSVVIAEDEYAVLTVNATHHAEDHLLVGTCDDATLPDCTWTYCGRLPESRRAPRDVCLPGKVYRKIYDRRRGPDAPPAGESFIAEPFCVKGRCELGFALWVVSHDESITRRATCRLNVGEMRFEDRPRGHERREGDFESLRLKCEIHSKQSNDPPRECYPVY